MPFPFPRRPLSAFGRLEKGLAPGPLHEALLSNRAPSEVTHTLLPYSVIFRGYLELVTLVTELLHLVFMTPE